MLCSFLFLLYLQKKVCKTATYGILCFLLLTCNTGCNSRNEISEQTMTYKPKPADTSAIELTEELKEIAESMARNVHENWAAERMAAGWTYGPQRDDANKKHPCLVPYEQLSEEEKDYDRMTSVETIKFLVSEGFAIVRNTGKDK